MMGGLVNSLQSELDELRMQTIRLEHQSTENISNLQTVEFKIKDTEKAAHEMTLTLAQDSTVKGIESSKAMVKNFFSKKK